MVWRDCRYGPPERECEVLALCTDGEVYRARWAWNGRQMVWAYYTTDAGLPSTPVWWLPFQGAILLEKAPAQEGE